MTIKKVEDVFVNDEIVVDIYFKDGSSIIGADPLYPFYDESKENIRVWVNDTVMFYNKNDVKCFGMRSEGEQQ